MDGYQVCQLIRSDRRLRHTRIVAVTAYHSQAVRQEILNAGADEYLVKPFTPDEFCLVIEKLLSDKQSHGTTAGAEIRGSTHLDAHNKS
jgi:CheY-like chemotaxis protein